MAMLPHPQFLFRATEAYPDNIGARLVNCADAFSIFFYTEVPEGGAVRTGNLEAGDGLFEIRDHAFRNARQASVKEMPVAFGYSRGTKRGHEVRTGDSSDRAPFQLAQPH